MFGKSTSIFYKMLILVVAVALTGVVTYLIDISLDNKIKTDGKFINLIERNNSYINSILLNSEKIFTQENTSKKNIQQAESLIDFSISVLKNGGIPPNFEEGEYLNFPGDDMLETTIEVERYWYVVKKTISTIVSQSAYIVAKSKKDSLFEDGFTHEVEIVERKRNGGVQTAVVALGNDSEILIQKSNALVHQYKSRIEDVEFRRNVAFTIAVILVMLLSAVLIFFIRTHVLKTVQHVSDELEHLSRSEIGTELKYDFKDELSPLIKNLNTLKNKYLDFVQFISDLGKGNYDSKLNLYNKNSRLDKGLAELRDKLLAGETETAAARQAEEQRRWAIEGQSKFNEILRISATNVQQLSDAVIKNLVLFLKAAQGGIFLKTEEGDKKYLDLISAFAYDRKKFFTKRIAFGNGLVGTAALEKNTVWLDRLPRDYMEIESGLGEAPPKSLLIVPLKTETELLGVFEIATFTKFKAEEVAFVENLAQNIAATIQSAKISERTSELLTESQKKTEELASRDIEMRQTIRELQKAKAEAEKNDAEMTALLSALDQAMLSAEISVKQRILSANRQFFAKADYHFDEIDGKPFFGFFKDIDSEPDTLFEKVLNGETTRATMKLISKYKSEFWILGQFTPVKDASGKIIKVLFLGNDITKRIESEIYNDKLLQETIEKAELLAEQEKAMRSHLSTLTETQDEIRNKEFEVRALLEAVDMSLIKAEYSPQGHLLSANNKFKDVLELTSEWLKNSKLVDFFNETTVNDFEKLHKQLLQDERSFQTGIELVVKNEKRVWLVASFSPVKNQSGEIHKIVVLANDISEQKQAELRISEQKAALLVQDELMKLNMEDMLEEHARLSERLKTYFSTEQNLNEKYGNQSDSKHAEWINSMIN